MSLDPARLPGGKPRVREVPPDQRFVPGSAYDLLDDMADDDTEDEDDEDPLQRGRTPSCLCRYPLYETNPRCPDHGHSPEEPR